MLLSLSRYEPHGDAEPMVGVAVRSRAHGAEVGVCAPPDFAEALAGVGAPPVASGVVPAGARL